MVGGSVSFLWRLVWSFEQPLTPWREVAPEVELTAFALFGHDQLRVLDFYAIVLHMCVCDNGLQKGLQLALSWPSVGPQLALQLALSWLLRFPTQIVSSVKMLNRSNY